MSYATVAAIYFMPNGNVAVFDVTGHQVPELQGGNVIVKRLQEMRDKGVDIWGSKIYADGKWVTPTLLEDGSLSISFTTITTDL